MNCYEIILFIWLPTIYTKSMFFLKKGVEKCLKICIFAAQFQVWKPMADTSIILSEIEVKLRKLIGVQQQLKEENRRLASENRMLREQNEALVQTSQELHDKINKNTIVNALGNNEEEIKEGRKLIRELIKDIDQCVSILNTKE